MNLGIVVGNVVATVKNDGLDGTTYLLVDRCDITGKQKGDVFIALDAIGANQGEMVMVSEGSTARETARTTGKPLDALITGIVDLIDKDDKTVYRK